MRRFRLLVLVCAALALALPSALTQSPAEAPAAFDGLSNGFLNAADFAAAQEEFEEIEVAAGGLGPVYNAQGCAECHQTPVTGGVSQVTELRAGRLTFGGVFVDHPGGSLINDRAINAAFQEAVQPGNDVRTLRTSLNVLGDGFVEAIDSNTLVAISRNQPPFMRGQVIQVPVLEAGGALRVGRFGWKNQHASLQSFSADAYLDEMGITSPLQPRDNNSIGRAVVNGVAVTDGIADPEDEGEDVESFASFMRSTKAPPRDAFLAATFDARAGAQIFEAIGCAVCHVPSITTAPAGTRINGGEFVVPAALGGKRIRPFGDFLLHDVGTGDGIVQNGGPSTRNKMRTAPLWGVRTRSRLMHDGLSLTYNDAILRHEGEASFVTSRYRHNLSNQERNQLIAFLKSL